LLEELLIALLYDPEARIKKKAERGASKDLEAGLA